MSFEEQFLSDLRRAEELSLVAESSVVPPTSRQPALLTTATKVQATWAWMDKRGDSFKFDHETMAMINDSVARGRHTMVCNVQGGAWNFDFNEMVMRQIGAPDPESRIIIPPVNNGSRFPSRPLTDNPGSSLRSPRKSTVDSNKATHPPPLIPINGGESSWTCPQCTCVNPWPKLDHRSGVGLDIVEDAYFCSACEERSPHNLQEQATSKIFERINDICKSLKEPFVDDSFPPTIDSLLRLCHHTKEWQLIGSEADESVRHFVHKNDVVWRRPIELDRSRQWKMFQGTPRPGDITQGALGDCWLLSSLAVLAEQPALIDHILSTKEINENGVYQVKLCLHGEWKTIIVDDLLPCKMMQLPVFGQQQGQLVFGKGGLRGEQLWVPLIEKAAAKLFGSYAMLEGGNMYEGFELLSGAPCELLHIGSLDGQLCVEEEFHSYEGSHEENCNMLWAKMLSYRDSGFLMGASCCAYPVGDPDHVGVEAVSKKNAAEAMGLISNHAYSVLDVQVTTQGLQMIRLRNPWGTREWSGEWSDKSPCWTVALRQELFAYENDDGVFWMAFADFVCYFTDLTVAKIRKDWDSVNCQGQCSSLASSNNSAVTTPNQSIWAYRITPLDTESSTSTELTLHQPGGREKEVEKDILFVLTTDPDPGLAKPDFVARSKAAKGIQCASSNCETLLSPYRSYLALPMTFGQGLNGATSTDFVLSVHSAKPLLIQRVEKDAKTAAHSLLCESLAMGNDIMAGQDFSGTQYGLRLMKLRHDGTIFIVAINKSSTLLDRVTPNPICAQYFPLLFTFLLQ